PLQLVKLWVREGIEHGSQPGGRLRMMPAGVVFETGRMGIEQCRHQGTSLADRSSVSPSCRGWPEAVCSGWLGSEGSARAGYTSAPGIFYQRRPAQSIRAARASPVPPVLSGRDQVSPTLQRRPRTLFGVSIRHTYGAVK